MKKKLVSRLSSGRLKYLPENVKSYVGLDINEKCINTAKEYFSKNKKAKFYLFDIEDDDIQSVVNKKIDIKVLTVAIQTV